MNNYKTTKQLSLTHLLLPSLTAVLLILAAFYAAPAKANTALEPLANQASPMQLAYVAVHRGYVNPGYYRGGVGVGAVARPGVSCGVSCAGGVCARRCI